MILLTVNVIPTASPARVNERRSEMAIQKILPEKCIGCGICARSCPADVIRMDPETNRAYPRYPEDCVVCSICLADCPVDAIVMTPEVTEPSHIAWG